MWMLMVGLLVCGADEGKTEKTPGQTLQTGMWVLNGWAMTNMATGIPLSLTTDNETQQAFYQMNAGWNVLNMSLATLPLVQQREIDPARWSRIFWINAGLDVGYVATGLYMAHRGRSNNNPQMVGWGNAIALQGGFLVGFDAVMGWKMRGYVQ